MMKWLALDLSTRRGSIALSEANSLLFEHEWANDRRTAAPFFESVEKATKEFGRTEAILVGLGPGSYTGTRIAIATAAGLAAANGATIFGLPSILAVAQRENFSVIGDAKRSTFFFAKIRGQRLLSSIALLTPAELNARRFDEPVFTSDVLPQFPFAQLRFPKAALLLQVAQARPQNLIRAPLAPIYLRAPHITSK